MNTRRRLAIVLAAALAGGCSHGNGPATPATIVIGVTQEPQSLNPLLLQGAMSAMIDPALYSYLVTVNTRGNLVPDLAVRVPTLQNGGISRDGLTLRYRLRNGLKWQDGTPLTAADVAFTYAAIMNPKNNLPTRSPYDRIASVRALDSTTVQVRLKQPFSPIVSNFFAPDSNYVVLPAHLLKNYSDLNQIPFNASPVGSGPYRFVRWIRGDRLELRANPYYYNGVPPVSNITVKFVPDSNTLLEQLRTGETQVVFDGDPAHLAEYRQVRNATVTRTPITGTTFLLFNTSDAEMSDPLVRRALVEAIDIGRLVRDATRGGESPDDASRGFFTWAFDPSIHGPGYDPVDATRLLDQAGWKRDADGVRRKNGAAMHVQLAFPVTESSLEAVAVMLQQDLRQAGITLDVRRYSSVEFAAPASSGGPLFGGKFQVALLQILNGIDPNDAWFFGCDQIPPAGFNLTRFCDPVIERADAADAKTYDPAARRRLLAIVQREVARNVPFMPLWQRRSISISPSWLHNVSPSPLSSYWNIQMWRINAP